MKFDMNQIIKDYKMQRSPWREFGKWLFALLTGGLGGLWFAMTTLVIRKGEVGLRQKFNGELILLPPGRYYNFPWESYPVDPKPLSNKIILLGPYKIITVDTGCIAKTFNKGKLEILTEGQHLINDPSHVFDSFIGIKQVTKKLEQVTAFTRDNVGLTLHADVRYQIEVPSVAINEIDNIEQFIKEIAEVNIAQIVSHHSLSDFAPATTGLTVSNVNSGMGEVIKELHNKITEQLFKLGIKLLNIGITSWQINDKILAHELAQAAVVLSRTQLTVIEAKNTATVQQIKTNADVDTTIAKATAQAKAVKISGEAYQQIAETMKNPIAQGLYEGQQKIDMVSQAQNSNLFFSASSSAAPQPPSLNVIQAPGMRK